MFAAHACEICNTTARHEWFNKSAFLNVLPSEHRRRHGRFIVYQFKTVSLFSNRDSKITKCIPSSSSSSSSVTSPSSTSRLDSEITIELEEPFSSTANCSDSTSHEEDVSLANLSANFVGNTLTQSEAIETYTPYDVTSSRPRKMKNVFFANFGGIEKLFCASIFWNKKGG